MIANTRTIDHATLVDIEMELEFLSQFLSCLDAFTELGGPDTLTQVSANQLHGMFHTLRRSVDQIR